MKDVRLRGSYGATVFAHFYYASEDWRQGDYAPASASDNVPGVSILPPRFQLWRQGDSNP